MKSISKTCVLTAALILGACSHYSDDLASLDKSMKAKPGIPTMTAAAPQDIAPAAGPGAGSSMEVPLDEYLAREYYALAKSENDQAYDYKAAKQYTQKAVMASKGEAVPPFRVESYDVPEKMVPELNTARGQLISALQQGINTEALAKAQTSFDCWVERAEEASDETHYAECKGAFEQAMATLTAPAAGEASTVYQLSFLQTSSVPDEASKKRIQYIAEYLKAPQNTALTVALSAPADQVGAARLNAVKTTLVSEGVSADRILVTGQPIAPATVPATPVIAGSVQAMIVGTAETAGVATSNFVPVTPTEVPSGMTAADMAPSAGMTAPAPATQPQARMPKPASVYKAND